jgi:hypothetical protein
VLFGEVNLSLLKFIDHSLVGSAEPVEGQAERVEAAEAFNHEDLHELRQVALAWSSCSALLPV